MFNYVLPVLKILHVFNFRSLQQVRKYFNNRNFPIYGISVGCTFHGFAKLAFISKIICQQNLCQCHISRQNCAFQLLHESSQCTRKPMHRVLSQIMWRRKPFLQLIAINVSLGSPRHRTEHINSIHTTRGPYNIDLCKKVFLPPLQLKPYHARVKPILLIMETWLLLYATSPRPYLFIQFLWN